MTDPTDYEEDMLRQTRMLSREQWDEVMTLIGRMGGGVSSPLERPALDRKTLAAVAQTCARINRDEALLLTDKIMAIVGILPALDREAVAKIVYEAIMSCGDDALLTVVQDKARHAADEIMGMGGAK